MQAKIVSNSPQITDSHPRVPCGSCGRPCIAAVAMPPGDHGPPGDWYLCGGCYGAPATGAPRGPDPAAPRAPARAGAQQQGLAYDGGGGACAPGRGWPVSAYAAWLEWWTERAAIAEYEGGLTRAEAEAQADRIAGPPPRRPETPPAPARRGGAR